jgi:hypothetical protein
MTLAAQAASNATVSVRCTRSQEFWPIVRMAGTSGDSGSGVSGILFRRIHYSFTTQRLPPNAAKIANLAAHLPVKRGPAAKTETPVNPARYRFLSELPMPYALFSNDAKLSKTYPTEADVWKQARQSGLVVDAVSQEEKASPRPVLDNGYEIRPCRPEPHEDPAKNKADAERDAELELRLNS